MKRILSLIAALAIVCIGIHAAEPSQKALEFEQTRYDFGTIHASDGKVSHQFTFTNTSDKPVAIISMTNGGCGCTTPTFPREPIAPGKSASVSVTFDPTGRRGEFDRQVKVRYSVGGKKKITASLSFAGVIIP